MPDTPKDDASVFNRSHTTLRSPPKNGKPSVEDSNKSNGSTQPTTGSRVTNAPLPNSTKSDEIACNLCESRDTHTKLICSRCKRWWHVKCDIRDPPTRAVVSKGHWICIKCFNEENTIPPKPEEHDITRSNITDANLLGNINPLIDSNSTRAPHRTGSKSKASCASNASITSEARMKLLNLEHELTKRELDLEFEKKRIQIQREEIMQNLGSVGNRSCHSDLSSEPSIVGSKESRRKSIEKCINWVDNNKNKPKKVRQPVIEEQLQRSSMDLMNPDLRLDEFVDMTLNSRSLKEDLNLTRTQVYARQVVSKELPHFHGDPRDWPIFITKFRESTNQCGFTAAENLDRLSKCLKGNAYEAVRTDLSNPEALASVIATLKMLYGRPEMIYQALLDHVRTSPTVKIEKLETLITFAMRIKGLCDTLKSAEMTDYLNHPSLLTELTARLPPMLNYRWADYLQVMSDSHVKVTIESFNIWLRQQVEKLSRTASQYTMNQTTQKVDTRNNKKSTKEGFQGTHRTETECNYKNCKYCYETGHLANECEKFKELSVPKRWNMARRKYMCVCCLGKHILKNCGSIVNCGINGCKQPHHKLLHSEKGEHEDLTLGEENSKETTSQNVQLHSAASTSTNHEKTTEIENETEGERIMVHCNKNSKFQIIPIYLSNGNDKRIKTYAFLDSGSEITIVEDKLMKKLSISGPVEKLKLKWSNQCSRVEDKSQRVQVYITGTDEKETFLIKNARTVHTLELPLQSVETDRINQYNHLKGIPIEEYTNARPEILIGLDNHFLMSPIEVVEGEPTEPIAIRTRLGWTVFGNADVLEKETYAVNLHTRDTNDLHDLVEGYFAMESIGIRGSSKIVESNENARARKLMENTVKQDIDGKYEISLLWKNNNIRLPNSLPMAVRRLKCFENRLRKNPLIRENVNKTIREYHEVGYLEQLDESQLCNITDRTWYLPLFVVSNPNKPGKERLVWDAAAMVNGVSLNSNLLAGPDLNASLVSTLFKFREKRYAIGGDIKQMFHQIRIRTEDQDSQRCLWRENEAKPFNVSRMTVATFGASCSPTIAQFVKNFHASKYKSRYPRAVEAITERHYVDDYVDSFDTWEYGKKIAEQVAQILIEGGFFIRGFVSNEPRMISDLPCDDTIKEKPIEQHDDNIKLLGMWWETKKDVIKYRLNSTRIGENILDGSEIPTKRIVLRTVMMMFDPLGLLGFFTLKGKLVLKAIWKTQTDWDEQIKENEQQLWNEWVRDLKYIPDYEIRRRYFTNPGAKEYELHIFVDAGENAAAAVAYVVGCFKNHRESMIVGSKTKVAPNKCVSIPRMELQAAVIGTRLATHVKESHSIKFTRSVIWTDSRNVICWIRSPKSFKVFVAHRIAEIREYTKPADWRYVPTKLNPADHATKWKSWTNYIPNDWFTGPEFLLSASQNWPEEPTNLPEINEDILEIRCNVTLYDPSKSACPDVNRFSSWKRLVRAQAWALRIVRHHRDKLILTQDEIREATDHIIREVQQVEFEEDYQNLKTGKEISKNSRLRKYSPFLDQNKIIRMRSRLQEAEFLQYEQRNPIILPNKNPVTKLIVHDFHVKYWHANYNTVLNELRQIYVIPHMRSILKSVRSSCQTCIIRSARPQVPEMSTLPRSRLAARMKPFSYVGVDCFGPMLVKVHRRSEKRWGVIFTCLTTRAVHIELISSLSTDAFIMSLTCFIGRRGLPNEIFCDNGTNFRGADNELKRVTDENMQHAITDKFATIKFNFNPPSAPHMGGAWERLIRSIKAGLRHLLNGNVTSEELLRTSLIDIEMLINSRPLTYVATDENTHEALTPNHFLLGQSSGIKPFGNMCDDPEVLKKEWKRQQLITQTFWQRWTNEYLPEISKRTKWYDSVEPLRTGDVVAVVNSSIPNSWQLGRVVEVVKSKDGNIRQAEIKTSSGTLRRPSSKLAVLVREELRDTISSAGGSVTNATN